MREVERRGSFSRWDVTLAVALALFMNAALGPPAQAVMRYGPLQLSGNVDTLDLVRHSNPEKFQFIENRNTVRLRVDWDWLQNGRLIDRFDLPFIERSKVFLLYRGVYDGFYDIAPTDLQEGQTRYDDLVGGPIAGNRPGQCVGGPCDGTRPLLRGGYSRLSGSDRSGLKFENRIREAYIDLKIKNAPISFRLGRQQVIWGESDQFRVMDCWNPLDVGWHFQVESWDELRVPLWLGKGLWDMGEVGPLSNAFLEVVYNPFDFQPGIKVDFMPRPWAVPFPDPLRGGQVQNSNGTLLPSASSTLISPVFNLQGTSVRGGDFKRNPQDASEFGTRFHAVTPQGLEFSLDYLYGRGRGLGGASAFAVKIDSVNFKYNPLSYPASQYLGRYQVDLNNPSSVRNVIPVDVQAKVIHPYMHIFGMTGNYFEGDYLQSVLRFETAYVLGEPFQSKDPDTLVRLTYTNPLGQQRFLSPLPCSRPGAQCSPLGFTKRDIWTGMAGFDRPTWIRFLNPRATWFLSAQFFWTYTTGGGVGQLVGNAPAGDSPYYGSAGRWVSGPYAGLVERQQDGRCPGPGCGNGDNIRRWEHLVTVAATSFYRGGTVVPFIASAWDPVNDSEEILWNIDYYYTNNFIISLQQKFFTTYGSKAPSNDSEYTAGRFDRRDETGVRLTYQF